jgi:AcrR family transcriptional regulator
MGIAERREKEKIELRALILSAAKKLFVIKGIEHTTIRNIAEAIDYSVGTVYVYFKDKNAIFHALHSQGFNELGQQLALLMAVENPMERVKALGRVYINFAKANADMYSLMFSQPAPIDYLEEEHADEWKEGVLAFNVLKGTLAQCIEQGYFKGHTLEPLTYLFWSAVHGMCALYISERAKGVNLTDPDTIVERGYEEFLKMIGE